MNLIYLRICLQSIFCEISDSWILSWTMYFCIQIVKLRSSQDFERYSNSHSWNPWILKETRNNFSSVENNTKRSGSLSLSLKKGLGRHFQPWRKIELSLDYPFKLTNSNARSQRPRCLSSIALLTIVCKSFLANGPRKITEGGKGGKPFDNPSQRQRFPSTRYLRLQRNQDSLKYRRLFVRILWYLSSVPLKDHQSLFKDMAKTATKKIR